MKKYDILDIVKFILSIMIVAIHSGIFPYVLYPWLRLAVPLFFMISSFLIFSKVNNSPNNKKWIILKKYVMRLLKYYLFWFIVLIPITIFARQNWYSFGLVKGIFITIRETLFCSSFLASWFIVAAIYATLIIAKLSERINKKILLLIFIFIYIVCCLRSSYFNWFEKIPYIKYYFSYEKIFTSPVLSFPVALIWVFIGKYFADKDDVIIQQISIRKNIMLIILFSILLYLEWIFVINLNGTFNNDCYLFLVPLSFLIFSLIIKINIKLKNSVRFRVMSSIIYPLHSSVIVVLKFILNKFIFNSVVINLISFIFALLCCYVVFLIITKLENKKYFRLLKYSH